MTDTDRIRAVLGAPRGRRFTRPVATTTTATADRHRILLEEMRDNPRVRYRQRHGVLPAWMDEPRRRPTNPPAPVPVPRPRTAPDDDPRPQNPKRPPLPRRRSRHRKPPRRLLPLLTLHALTALAGAGAYHLVMSLP
ncbi:hypothetical protein KIK06_13370 [Nocardiopsis sp. EMB25]|uniref:hypothetical protein n=1 Tax=Nocardiopsis TaxID=2013 RepID=UPI0003493FB8|nr:MULTISPECIES: hypothetical protein [Nocardiopsis]MCY9784881.1 hypothetical protein [Nocardiopsis sp. EMB25]